MAKGKEKKKMFHIGKLTKRIGETKNIGNFESLRVDNELEATFEEGATKEDILEAHDALRVGILKLNRDDFDKLMS